MAGDGHAADEALPQLNAGSKTGRPMTPIGKTARKAPIIRDDESVATMFAAIDSRRNELSSPLAGADEEPLRPSSTPKSNLKDITSPLQTLPLENNTSPRNYESASSSQASPSSPSHKERDKSDKAKKKARKKKKQEIRALVKSTLAEILAALETEKGSQILELAARVRAAAIEKAMAAYAAGQGESKSKEKTKQGYCSAKLRRKDASSSLGLTFHTPGRIQSKNIKWQMQQYLIVTEVADREGVKHSLQPNDVVLLVDDSEVHTIQDLQNAVAGKRKVKFQVIRGDDIDENMLNAARAEVRADIEASVKQKVKEQFKSLTRRALEEEEGE